jgi:hypothetical protein
MAFGKGSKTEAEDQATGRYVVERVASLVTGKRVLQSTLNEGAAKGWALHTIVPAGQSDFVLVVWDRAG